MTWPEGTLHYRLCLLAAATHTTPAMWADESWQTIETMLTILTDKGKGKHRKDSPGAGGSPIYSG